MEARRRTIGERIAARFVRMDAGAEDEPLAQVGASTDGLFCFEDDRRQRTRFVREARRELAALIDAECLAKRPPMDPAQRELLPKKKPTIFLEADESAEAPEGA